MAFWEAARQGEHYLVYRLNEPPTHGEKAGNPRGQFGTRFLSSNHCGHLSFPTYVCFAKGKEQAKSGEIARTARPLWTDDRGIRLLPDVRRRLIPKNTSTSANVGRALISWIIGN